MGLNSTPSGERVHIAFFGKRNSGKSSLVNAVTGQNLCVVSDVKGTTTDPVYKSMELLPLGAVMIIDTAGFDDCGELGEMRIQKTMQVLNKTDIAVLVTDSETSDEYETKLVNLFRNKKIPYITVRNKCDLLDEIPENDMLYTSTLTGYNINLLKEKLARMVKTDNSRLIGNLVKPDDFVILVTPVDESAPKGRLILPQQQAIRDILDSKACSVVIQETQLKNTLEKITPSLVITDSQVFKSVSARTPENIPLTSFSILMAKYKGFLDTAVDGVSKIKSLKDGDRILISEGCTHHRQCKDIGTVKLPNWLRDYTKKDFKFEFSSGTEFPENLSQYSLVIHCGGCMLNSREVQSRMERAVSQKIPFTNYGISIAYMNGILKRSLEIFPELAEKIN
ncbi:MAG: [FeFe] hydrogenase H-cluster maturation GTPase HydF [Oscillospiraceae bacterium]|nr:[FeFe] hydrogenase H-cluster maturation GTPase HydF [Oscillospiraceae bacterium]